MTHGRVAGQGRRVDGTTANATTAATAATATATADERLAGVDEG